MKRPDPDDEFEGATEVHPRAAAAEASFRLTVTSGMPGDRGRALMVLPHTASPLLVGQSPRADLPLSDPSVSRRHLSLEVALPGLRVIDLDSRNGTRLEGHWIKEAFAVGGETLRLGGTALSLERVMSPRTTPPPASQADGFGKLHGASPAMRRLYPLCQRLADSVVPVVIEGETGTGKEVLAESLHTAGPRRDGPFVVFDCTAVPANLLEATLFGHERGAFTGATEARAGLFEEAHGGTLLIDEIGDLALDLQAKLLRALERAEVRRLGGKRWLRVDVRVVAATRRDLDKEVAQGRFRDDLFFRLAVARIELPPLRRREGDVGLLARHFWRRLAGPTTPMPEEFLARLEAAPWPGNVRELHNSVARKVALGDEDPWGRDREVAATNDARLVRAQEGDGFGDGFDRILARDLPLPRAREMVVAGFERRYLEQVLARHGGNVRRAAEASGVALRYFQLLRARNKREGEPTP